MAMAGHYNQFGDNYSFLPQYYTIGDNGQPVTQAQGYFGGGLLQYHPQRAEPLNNRFVEFEELQQPMLPAQGGSRVRRRVGAGGEHVKFRRTRSGCFTCRNRRVKCDEARPVCERCRKGNRECAYPEKSSSSKTRRASAKEKPGEGESVDEDEGESQGEESDLAEGQAGVDDDEPASAGATEPSSATSAKSEEGSALREASDPPPLNHGESPTPSTEGSASIDVSPLFTSGRPPEPSKLQRTASHKKISELPNDLVFFLSYARTSLGAHHYGFKYQDPSFLKNTLIEVALRYEPLLYAVVGFAAYHHTLAQPNGHIDHFLRYYMRSVSLLRMSLIKSDKPSIATLLTVLQLATIEEYLGDWVNCMAHQAAAYQILTQLYTPQTVMANESVRMIFHWYIRFDIFAGVLSGYGTALTGEWFEACHTYYDVQTRQQPDNLTIKYEERWARLRLLVADITLLCSRKGRDEVPDQEFNAHLRARAEEITNWANNLHPALQDRSKLVTDFSGAPPIDPNDIVDPYDPELLYGGDIFLTNFLALDFLGLDLLVNHQLPETFQGSPRSPRAQEKAYKICQIFEALQLYPGSPPGVVLGMQSPLGVAAVFLPQDDRHSMWARRKLATVEAHGYVYPLTFRMRLANYWNADVSDWWLPNEEGLPPIIRSIHEFIAERKTAPGDKKAEDVRDMKGFFTSLRLSDSSSPESVYGSIQEPRLGIRDTASEGGGVSGQQTDMGPSAAFGPASAGPAHATAVVFGDSPELTWGYEQPHW